MTKSPIFQPTAAIIIIGNEILSGRTKDANINPIARFLKSHGIRLQEVRVISDVEEAIIEAINHLRRKHSYVFTTGGIGSTHDDITAYCIAKALGRPLIENAEAVKILEYYYKSKYRALEDPTMRFNSTRRRMALMPEGSHLIANVVSGAPGFYIDNVYVMAGIPGVVEAMLESIKTIIPSASPILTRTVRSDIVENLIADELEDIQNAHPEVEIGSYPFFEDNMYGTHLVVSSIDQMSINTVIDKLFAMLKNMGGKPQEIEEI